MATLVIGSTAARHWFPDWREPKDYDVYSDSPVDGDVFWDDRLYNLIGRDTTIRMATPDELLSIKWSHAYWELKNGSWGKHMADLLDLERRGAQLIPEWHDVLYRIWEDKHGKKKVDLTMESGGDDEEVWLPYPGDTRYSVSNLGRVRGPRKLLEGTECSGPVKYRQYGIGRESTKLGHSLVMETFVGPLPVGMQVRHLDGDPQNNRVSNLMYGTPLENAADKQRLGTTVRGEVHKLAKLTEESVASIRAEYARGDVSQRQLASKYGVAQSLVGRVINHQSWQGEKGFFEDAVKRVYDHDSLHLSVAYTPGRPIYDECLKDGKSVQMDMAKVWAMPHEKIVQMFREEVYVTALERLVIPSGYRHSPGGAYQWALRRTITSLTKGRSARFLVEHFGEFCKPDVDYVAVHRANASYLKELAHA